MRGIYIVESNYKMFARHLTQTVECTMVAGIILIYRARNTQLNYMNSFSNLIRASVRKNSKTNYGVTAQTLWYYRHYYWRAKLSMSWKWNKLVFWVDFHLLFHLFQRLSKNCMLSFNVFTLMRYYFHFKITSI